MPMTTDTAYVADHALVGDTIEPNVTLRIDATGSIIRVGGPAEGAIRLPGLTLPGIPNLHSHAFQRAMAGLAERAGPGGDSFWTWRDTMYRFLSILTPEDVEAIAAQLYAECLRHGFTTVGEFHYVHNAPDGRSYADPAEMSARLLAAAQTTGIGLTLMPVLYQTSQFGGVPPTEGQRRFVRNDDGFAELVARVVSLTAANPNWRAGIAPHSLRAVEPAALARVVALRNAIDGSMPIHIHAAEQTKEVADCLAWSGRRPVEWLLDHGAGPGWCLIHATHLTDEECRRLAGSGAIAGLCPATEANLGDGFFPIREYVAQGGPFGVGTDSHVSTSPVEELRWLEYGCRLQLRARNVVEPREGVSVGATLVARALSGGATALARPIGAIEAGRRADLIVLDTDHPALVGRPSDRWLDAFIFCGNDSPVRDVMVGGRMVVKDGAHLAAEPVRARFRATMRRLAAAL